jgi:hypothetical protein
MNGSAKNAARVVRKAPMRATTDRATMTSQAMPRARYDPVGSRLTERIARRARRNFSRASASWSGLARAM